uniref:Uncharacterized protein n=1 Tax=Ciona savignyi TaxID=51511 RepID=H2YS95_CIOSA
LNLLETFIGSDVTLDVVIPTLLLIVIVDKCNVRSLDRLVYATVTDFPIMGSKLSPVKRIYTPVYNV